MKRTAQSVFAGGIVLVAILGFAGAADAATPRVAPREFAAPGVVSSVVRAGVDDFQFESFSAEYYLDTDAAGRSTLKTVETFVATFPSIDQNHGMKRAIPGKYQGAPTDVSVQGVTDGNGTPRPYTVATDDNGFVVVTSREDGFVHGNQTYVFTYTQRNVTRFFANTNADEFYWDTNGTGWYQYFASVSARVHVPAKLASALNGQTACYQGYEGSTQPCQLSAGSEPAGTVLAVGVKGIEPFQNVTVSVGFQPRTFVPRDDSYLASSAGLLQLLSVIAGVIAAIWAIILRMTVLADGRGRPTIIAEYSPPAGIDPIVASVVLKKTSRAAAAQFVDFAVRRRIRIVETTGQGWLARGPGYLFELLDGSGLSGSPLDLARALFGYELAPGSSYQMSSKDVTLSERVRSTIRLATAAAVQDGLRKKGQGGRVALPALLALAGAVGTFVFGIRLLDAALGGPLPFILFVPPVIAVLLVFGLVSRTPLTAEGAELRDHLKGLELYIRLAEADRLRMLQSPTGAERSAVSPSDPRQVIEIYEKLLPYAVLFSLEREWAVELGKYYTDSPPDWYSGTGAFNATLFASSIGSMSTAAASSYSGSSSSSSSGGSGGGGSSGGGGGGGGGGGV